MTSPTPADTPSTAAAAGAAAVGQEQLPGDPGDVPSYLSHRQILAAYRLLAREEGVFVEMASAASVAGLLDAGLERGLRVVCTVTGNGLKDPDWALSGAPEPTRVPADPEAAAAALQLG